MERCSEGLDDGWEEPDLGRHYMRRLGGREGGLTNPLVAPHSIPIPNSFQNQNILLSLSQFPHYSNHCLTLKQWSGESHTLSMLRSLSIYFL